MLTQQLLKLHPEPHYLAAHLAVRFDAEVALGVPPTVAAYGLVVETQHNRVGDLRRYRGLLGLCKALAVLAAPMLAAS